MNTQLIQLPVVHDARGNLTFVESSRQLPFELKRVYYLYDVPGGAERGGHAHKVLHQMVIALSGSFDVTVDDGISRRVYQLNRPHVGLHIPPMHWRVLDNFSSGSVCLALASEFFSEDDYLRDYDGFLTQVRESF